MFFFWPHILKYGGIPENEPHHATGRSGGCFGVIFGSFWGSPWVAFRVLGVKNCKTSKYFKTTFQTFETLFCSFEVFDHQNPESRPCGPPKWPKNHPKTSPWPPGNVVGYFSGYPIFQNMGSKKTPYKKKHLSNVFFCSRIKDRKQKFLTPLKLNTCFRFVCTCSCGVWSGCKIAKTCFWETLETTHVKNLTNIFRPFIGDAINNSTWSFQFHHRRGHRTSWKVAKI